MAIITMLCTIKCRLYALGCTNISIICIGYLHSGNMIILANLYYIIVSLCYNDLII